MPNRAGRNKEEEKETRRAKVCMQMQIWQLQCFLENMESSFYISDKSYTMMLQICIIWLHFADTVKINHLSLQVIVVDRFSHQRLELGKMHLTMVIIELQHWIESHNSVHMQSHITNVCSLSIGSLKVMRVTVLCLIWFSIENIARIDHSILYLIIIYYYRCYHSHYWHK